MSSHQSSTSESLRSTTWSSADSEIRREKCKTSLRQKELMLKPVHKNKLILKKKKFSVAIETLLRNGVNVDTYLSTLVDQKIRILEEANALKLQLVEPKSTVDLNPSEKKEPQLVELKSTVDLNPSEKKEPQLVELKSTVSLNPSEKKVRNNSLGSFSSVESFITNETVGYKATAEKYLVKLGQILPLWKVIIFVAVSILWNYGRMEDVAEVYEEPTHYEPTVQYPAMPEPAALLELDEPSPVPRLEYVGEAINSVALPSQDVKKIKLKRSKSKRRSSRSQKPWERDDYNLIKALGFLFLLL